MAVTVKEITLWRREIENRPGMLAHVLEPLAGSAADVQVRFGDRIRSSERGQAMAIYMVDRSLPGITMDQLAAAQKAAIDTAKKFTAEGKPVRYIRSTFVPSESRCMCLFEARSPEAVKELNDQAKIPYTRVVEAADLTP